MSLLKREDFIDDLDTELFMYTVKNIILSSITPKEKSVHLPTIIQSS